jgi:deoxyribose-phosphate aldolase
MKAMSAELAARFAPAPRQIQPTPPKKRDASDIAARIDHTLLKPEAGRADIRRACDEARVHGFATVCLNSAWIPLAANLLKGSRSLPIAVVGFPLGASSTAAKAFETRQAISDGAREIDMVLSIGALKSEDYETAFKDIQSVVEAAHPYPVKVILETSALNLKQKIAGCALSQAAGAAFVKTSTGFGSGGATAEDISLMRQVVGPGMGVKASGGIRSREDAERMIAAGADRIGASTSVAIVTGKKPAAGSY